MSFNEKIVAEFEKQQEFNNDIKQHIEKLLAESEKQKQGNEQLRKDNEPIKEMM